MVLLWVLWTKGYVVQGIRQAVVDSKGQLAQRVGALRIFGFMLIVAGLVGILLGQSLTRPNPPFTHAAFGFS
jgi:PAT family beta-lactamase induction signal transducer AmpG